VVVHGESGSGKTALVNKLRDVVCKTAKGFFVGGKFFQPDRTVQEEPYSAIMAAFSDLCHLLVIQSDNFDEAQRQKIGDALGTDSQLLVESISNLSPHVGDQSGEVDHVELLFAKFKVACKNFLHTLASEQYPIVVFLDNIQWADKGLTQLIQAFLQDLELKNVMLILAYRDEDPFHLCDEGGALAHAAARDHTDIALSNLDAQMLYIRL
jgi:histidine kinase